MLRFLISILIAISLFADAGMIPLSEVGKIDLKEKGLDIEQSLLFDSGDESLINGIVKVNGCTGTFVSENGLILTNHHCAYRAIKNVSTAEKDYLADGFISKSLETEIPAKGYKVRITLSYEDVSEKVLSALSDGMSPLERSKAIEKRQKELVKEAEDLNPGKRADISEMFKGKSYFLFIYEYLKDIRLVYAPPKSIGNFGGETDNWIWPRHTGDFSFMRAYVGADGQPAEYSENNIPYTPKKFIQIETEGVDDGDFVFILGYPGRTYRNYPSAYLEYAQNVRMPKIKELYDRQISLFEKVSGLSHDYDIKLASKIKGRANVSKNYSGKLLGLKRTQLLKSWQNTDAELKEYIHNHPELDTRYETLFQDLNDYYTERAGNYYAESVINRLSYQVVLADIANTLYEASVERLKDDLDRKSAYMDRNMNRTTEGIYLALDDYVPEADEEIFSDLIRRYAENRETHSLSVIDKRFRNNFSEKNVRKVIKKMMKKSKLSNPELVREYFTYSKEELEKIKDPFLQFMIDLKPYYDKKEDESKARRGKISVLMADYLDIKQKVSGNTFIPDANSTLRLTYGYIKGYSPRDAVWSYPSTTIRGLLEKDTGKAPFNLPKIIKRAYEKDPEVGKIPVAMLYNLDTTGGNSGSSVLNKRGQLVGLNFDRAYEATINDYAWNESYSRSIGVDVRYILWIVNLYAPGHYILTDINVAN